MTIHIAPDFGEALRELYETTRPCWHVIARDEIAEVLTTALVAAGTEEPAAQLFGDTWASRLVVTAPLSEPCVDGTTAIGIFDDAAGYELEHVLREMLGDVPSELWAHALYLDHFSDASRRHEVAMQKVVGASGSYPRFTMTASTWQDCLDLLGLAGLDPNLDTIDVATLRRAIVRYRTAGAPSPARESTSSSGTVRDGDTIRRTATMVIPGRCEGYLASRIADVEDICLYASANGLTSVSWS